ncbi:MAG: hypothetical protein M5U28_38960 [Sandaracinaceae bacterium]|nr:hypothetical protein [Sandaracinaceae bacterium]
MPAERPAVEEFRRQVEELRRHPDLKSVIKKGEVHFVDLSLEQVRRLFDDSTGYYFLMAAAKLTRTTLKKAAADERRRIVRKEDRRAHAVQEALPHRRAFEEVAAGAVAIRTADLRRMHSGGVEQLFRDRLIAEKIPIVMQPPIRAVPGILIGRRKPDGVYPDPATDAAPVVYLEIKNIRRVSDDIQKRLYEVAEASLEMKLIYGGLELRGLNVRSLREVGERAAEIRAAVREQIRKSRPYVVVLMLCSKVEAERYRDGAEAFVDRVFFEEEIEECLAFLRQAAQPE